MTLIYPNETRLFRICAIISTAVWLLLIVGTLGLGLLYVGLFAFVALVAQSAFISHLRGTGVRVSREQLPELHEQVQRCCRALGIADPPEVYVLNANGILNALAARFLRRHYVVLYGDVVDKLRERPGALAFYIGHELGHIARGHLVWGPLLWPARGLPLIGAAYARAGEYTCDLHGLACCENPEDALHGVAVLAAGGHAANQLDVAHYAAQSETSGGFWMSLHELVGDYPWLTKRVHRLLSASRGETSALPRRHALAWFFAFFVPHVGGGLAGAPLVLVAIVGMLAAIAIPNFVKFQARAKAAQIGATRLDLQQSADTYIVKHGKMPPSLAALGLSQPDGAGPVTAIDIEAQGFRVSLAPSLGDALGAKSFTLRPYVKAGHLHWNCGEELDAFVRATVCGAAKSEPEAAAAEEPAPAAPEPAAAEPAPRSQPEAASADQLLGRWQPLSDESATFHQIVLGAGHSAIVTLADGSKALGTFEFDGRAVAMEISTPAGTVTAHYELAASGDRVLLRPLAGGPFYAKN